MRKWAIAAALVLMAGTTGAEEVTCNGNIISIQGEGMVASKHRFEVSGVSGSDVLEVLEKCKKIAQERQGRSARKNPGGSFRKSSEVDLRCTQGSKQFEVRRTLQTAP